MARRFLEAKGSYRVIKGGEVERSGAGLEI